MKKIFAVAAVMSISLGAEAAYRDNGGVAWPTLFGGDKTDCVHSHKTPASTKVASFDSVTFGYKSTSVSGSQDDLNNAKAVINAHPRARFVVVGHTDSKGSEAFNQDLSERRAQAVMNWLVENGVDAGRLSAIGRGETAPVADNGTAEGRAKNRRVELHRAR